MISIPSISNRAPQVLARDAATPPKFEPRLSPYCELSIASVLESDAAQTMLTERRSTSRALRHLEHAADLAHAAALETQAKHRRVTNIVETTSGLATQAFQQARSPSKAEGAVVTKLEREAKTPGASQTAKDCASRGRTILEERSVATDVIAGTSPNEKKGPLSVLGRAVTIPGARQRALDVTTGLRAKGDELLVKMCAAFAKNVASARSELGSSKRQVEEILDAAQEALRAHHAERRAIRRALVGG